MNRNISLLSALSAGMITAAVVAQTAGAQISAAPAPAPAAAASTPPQAIPAKIALIAFEQAVFATNEGQKMVQDVQAKYAPKKTEIDGLSGEVDSMKKQLQGASATLSDADRAAKLKAIDVKEKQLSRQAEEATSAYNADLQEAYSKVAQKVSTTLKNYVAQNGYTLLLDVSNQQSAVMWALPNTDVTEAVVNAYNTSSGIAAPAPAAPSAPSATRPSGSGTAPKPAAPKAAAPK